MNLLLPSVTVSNHCSVNDVSNVTEGYVLLKQVLRLGEFRGFTVADVQRVVQSNDKQRFGLVFDEDRKEFKIRAHQGHTKNEWSQ